TSRPTTSTPPRARRSCPRSAATRAPSSAAHTMRKRSRPWIRTACSSCRTAMSTTGRSPTWTSWHSPESGASPQLRVEGGVLVLLLAPARTRDPPRFGSETARVGVPPRGRPRGRPRATGALDAPGAQCLLVHDDVLDAVHHRVLRDLAVPLTPPDGGALALRRVDD